LRQLSANPPCAWVSYRAATAGIGTREAEIMPGGYSQRNVCGASRIRNSRAGAPATTAFSGTSAVITELVPMIALSPTVTPRRRQAP